MTELDLGEAQAAPALCGTHERAEHEHRFLAKLILLEPRRLAARWWLAMERLREASATFSFDCRLMCAPQV